MRVLVTGGTGFIGRHLVESLLQRGDEVVVSSRSPSRATRLLGGQAMVVGGLPAIAANSPIDAIVNLAGQPILDRRWSESVKAKIRDSRLQTTQAVIDLIQRLEQKPRRLISGSAIGFYGPQQDDQPLHEDGPVVSGFTHELCHAWEAEADKATVLGVPVAMLRTGVVLGKGGALARMLFPFRLGLGGPIGDGKQWFSWIHIDDMVQAILFLLDHPQHQGAFNLTAPEPVTNEVFSKQLAEVLHRPAFFRTPALIFQVLLGEGSELLTHGQRVVPGRLQEAGFEFEYPELRTALEQLFG